MYVAWPPNVNQKILDTAEVSVGNGATKEDSLEVGKGKSKLVSPNAPKQFSVTMDFDFSEKDGDGLTEKDRFYVWYKNILKYGANYFSFPSIILGRAHDKYGFYRIRGATNGAVSGLCQRITMVWESCYEGIISISRQDIDRLYLTTSNGSDYYRWPLDVNMNVLDSTTVTSGEGAAKEITLETGAVKSRAASSNPPDTFSVVMDFDDSEKDENGLTEKDRFYNWYQYILGYGANYFSFPSVLLGRDKNVVEYYRIKESVSGTKHGLCQRVVMTWESDYEGEISVSESERGNIAYIEVTFDYVDIYFDIAPLVPPAYGDFTLTIDGIKKYALSFLYDGSKKGRLYIPYVSTAFSVSIAYNGQTFSAKVPASDVL